MSEKEELNKSKAQKMLAWALTEKLEGSPRDEEMDLPGYDIIGILGRGGMGTVYKARHDGLGRTVALKVFTARGSDQDLFIERLKREGRLMAQLEHPNVLGIYDADVLSDETPYLVLEYVEGEDLQKKIYEQKKLRLKEALRIAVKVCDGLSAVHSLGIIHRDIKPANVLLGVDGSVKVTDFGVSKETSGQQNTALTMTGTTIGTVDYMSPEQSNGQTVDERSDIYSVGVLLYEMVSGVTPRGAFEPLAKHGAPKDLDRLVMRCLQRDPSKRPGSAANVSAQLKKVYKQLRKNKVRNVGSGLYSALAGLACLGVLGMFVAREMRGRPAEEVADPAPERASVVPAAGEERRIGEWIDLTAGLDVAASTLSGQWWEHEGTLISNDSAASLLQFDAAVSGDYVIEVAFTKVSGEGEIVLLVPSAVGMLSVSIDAAGMRIPELGTHSRGVSENLKRELSLGSVYTLLLEVKGLDVVGKINGATWAVWKLGSEKVKRSAKWRKAAEGKVAVGVSDSQVLFNSTRLMMK